MFELVFDLGIKVFKFFSFFALAVILFMVIGTMNKVDATLNSLKATSDSAQVMLVNANQRLTYTDQNVNAALVQFGLVMDNVRRASEKQGQATDKELAILAQTDSLLTAATKTVSDQDGNLNSMFATINPLLTATTKTVQDTDSLVTNPDVTKALFNIQVTTAQLAITGKHLADATDQAAGTLTDIHKKVDDMLKPQNLFKSLLSDGIHLGADFRTLIK